MSVALRYKLTESSDDKQHSEAEKTTDEPKLAEDEDYESTEDDTDPSYTYCWPKVRATLRATPLRVWARFMRRKGVVIVCNEFTLSYGLYVYVVVLFCLASGLVGQGFAPFSHSFGGLRELPQ